MHQEKGYIGYLKYSGRSVEDGFLDARKSADALFGFDEILRYFLLKEDPSLKDVDFEIPVKIQKGSWDIVIPEIIDKLFSPTGIATTAFGTYATVTAKKAAEDGLFKSGIAKDLKITFRAALKSAQWVIRIGSHVGTLTKKQFEDVKIIQETEEIQIPNDQKEYLRVPRKYLDIYRECPPKLFSKNASIVQSDRILELGVFDEGSVESVFISEKQKNIYYTKSDEADNNVVLPELKNGQFVELEGKISRVTESTNTIGFDYQGHTLTCRPEENKLALYKDRIISKVDGHVLPKIKIIGRVDRNSESGQFKEKRPQIIFSNIVVLDETNEVRTLFNRF